MHNIYIDEQVKNTGMKTIGIRKYAKEQLSSFFDDDEVRTMDDAVNRLLDLSELDELDFTRSSIHIKESTYERLKQYKAYSTESHSDVIARLLQTYQK